MLTRTTGIEVEPLWTQSSTLHLLADWAVVILSGVALATLILTLFQVRSERAFRRRAQASQVFVLLRLWDPEGGHLLAHVANNSDGPLHMVSVTLLKWEWPELREVEASRLITVMSPRSEAEVNFQLPPPPPDLEDSVLIPPVELGFRDANGIRWLRGPDGSLIEVDD